MESYKDKCKKLQSMMEEYTKEDIIIAFSGGVDSSLLLKLACVHAKNNGSKVYAVTLHTMLHPIGELENAKKVAEEVGAIHIVIKVDELKNAGVMNNPVDRCYLCKKYLFKEVMKEAEKLGVNTIIEGTNEDDLHVYRPGIKAIKELGIISPLAMSKITKDEVRKLALEYKVSVSNKPSTPCLATRFPYGTEISYEKMHKVDLGEAYIKSFGVYNIRLRIHENIARIEVDENDIKKVLKYKKDIILYLKKLGYDYITIDLEGFRSGSMDIVL